MGPIIYVVHIPTDRASGQVPRSEMNDLAMGRSIIIDVVGGRMRLKHDFLEGRYHIIDPGCGNARGVS